MSSKAIQQPAVFRQPDRARTNWQSLQKMAGEWSNSLMELLCVELPKCPDPDLALNSFERLVHVHEVVERLPALLANQGAHLATLLQLLSVSEFFADTLVKYVGGLDLLFAFPRYHPTTDELVQQLRQMVELANDDATTLAVFREFRQLQMLRIGVNDIIRDRSLEEITRDLSRVADASLKVAVQVALKTTSKKFGTPMTHQGEPARVSALAFGKLGGDELNYSSDIDLMFVYDHEGETVGRRSHGIPNSEFFSRMVTEVIRLLSAVTDRGFAYRVDLRLRPEGSRGALARSLASTLSYYDVMGRTWERQALIKLRAVAGDRELGLEVMKALMPFVYRKYFSFSEINEVKALKRRMEQNATRAGIDDLDVKTGRGGIRDIEYTVQFLQLLNGGDLPAVRQRNTLLALEALEIAGCLTPQEIFLLSEAYRFLRKTEHRLQLLFDWQTHRLPSQAEELSKLARRMGYQGKSENTAETKTSLTEVTDKPLSSSLKRPLLDDVPEPPFDTRVLLVDPLELFLKDYHDKTNLNRAILDHLLHQTFADADSASDPEADLILDPNPEAATIQATLGKYPFQDVRLAYQNLCQLAQESVPFLSHRRCRHFLASIAPRLLEAIATTADPDETLNTLERVMASLGAKAVMYELFSFNLPSLQLFVDLCANSPYLSGILIKNAGMEDELLDSLVLDQPRTAEELRLELEALLHGASDPEPILRSFQDKELLRIGVRDLLGKSTIIETTAALSDVAETIVKAIFRLVEPKVQAKLGVPMVNDRECQYVVVGLGKLGGREISYHSDLDMMIIYESNGNTKLTKATPSNRGTDNHHYFTALTQRVIQFASKSDPNGRLYEVDMRLRPTGKSGSLVIPLEEFERYYQSDQCQTWERQTLTRARILAGNSEFAVTAHQAIHQAILGETWCPEWSEQFQQMRVRLETAANPRSLKRGSGGLVDIEFLVQFLLLKYGAQYPEILKPNIWDAIASLRQVGLIDDREYQILESNYTFLRTVEARLRIVTDRPLTEIPESPHDFEKLARRAGYEDGQDRSAAKQFEHALKDHRLQVRLLFVELLDKERHRPITIPT